MATVSIGVSSMAETARRLSTAMSGTPQGAHISFDSVETLWRVIAPKRAAIIRVMTGQGVLSIREVARRLGRDVKAVHGDVLALVKAGVLDRQDGGVVFPFDEVKVAFDLNQAA